MPAKQKVVVFQIGSLGDTVISMPCYREIARRHPEAERYLLTNFPIGNKMVAAEALLKPCGLVQGSVKYPMPLRGVRDTLDLYRRLRGLRVDVLYYLTPEKRLTNLVRHYAFFKFCGVGSIVGLPWSRDSRYPRVVEPGKLWESEASRLLRTIGASEEAGEPAFADRSLELSNSERHVAQRLAASVPKFERFIAVSVGGKVPVNDWGDANWSDLLSIVSAGDPSLGVLFVGSADERDRNEALGAAWRGPKLNSCGLLTPRETAALIERAELFVGHDTGTLHLAAAVGTRIIGVYSARNVPGKWFSDRVGDRFFYQQPPCFGCEVVNVVDCKNGLTCMTAHRVDEIATAVSVTLRGDRMPEFYATSIGIEPSGTRSAL
jgi:heptosyltransferase-3